MYSVGTGRDMRKNSDVLIWYIFIILSVISCNAETFADQRRLHEFLEPRIHKNIRPIYNQSDAIDVDVQFSVLSVQALDEKTQVLSSTVGIVMSWTYETLAWKPAAYGGAKVVRLTASEVWLPDVALYNSIDNNQILNMEDEGAFKVSVQSDGRAVWSSGGNFDTNCKVDITNYPFDTQVCEYILGKYFSNDAVLNLVPVSNAIHMPTFVTNDVWHLEETGISKQLMSRNYSKIVVQLTLQRRPLFYILNVILPVGILSFMNVLSFKLPVTSGERVSFCVSLFLTFMVLLDTISDAMPKVSQSVSYLQMYVNTQLVMGMVITTISIVLVQMSVNWSDEHVPHWVKAMYSLTRRYRRGPQNVTPLARVDYNGLQDVDADENGVSPIEVCRENSSKAKASVTSKLTDPRITIKHLDRIFFYGFLCLFLFINVLFVVCMLTYTSE